jgi:DNA-binding HxlR family transcriptional regulator
MSARARESPVPSASHLIRLLATESSGEILRALSAGRLRSAELTDRLAQFSPRTIYRRLDELKALEAIAQRNLATVPPTVLYELTVQPGRDLLRVLDDVAGAWLGRWHSGVAEGQRWGLLALLADGWDSAIVRELSSEPRSLSELGVVSDLTYHQLARRVTRLTAAGLLTRIDSPRPARYELSEQTRQGMIVVAAAARWERLHLRERAKALPVSDALALLRSCLPLVRLAEHSGAIISVTVEGDDREATSSQRFGSLQVRVGPAGAVEFSEGGDATPDAWVRAPIDGWLDALVEGDCAALQVGGERALVDGQLRRLRAQTTAPTAVG